MNINEEEECGVPILELGVHMVTEAAAQMSMQRTTALPFLQIMVLPRSLFEHVLSRETRKSRGREKTRASSKTPQTTFWEESPFVLNQSMVE
jgi:hypothetical protein